MITEIQMGTAPILSVPFVVRDKILCKLTAQEQLALRPVCKTMREWIDTSSLPHHIPVTIIKDNGSKTFTKFMTKRAPHVITELHIENEGCDFLQDPSLAWFLHLHSSSIKKLIMGRYFTCRTPEELKFYESFVNLDELQLHKISIPSTLGEISSIFPENFKNLKVLKIGDVKAYPEPPDDSFGSTLIPLDLQRPMGQYVWKLIEYCENIEHLGYPNTAKYFFQAFVDGRGRGELGMFCDYIRNRSLQRPSKPNLKFCDLLNDSWPPDPRNTLALLRIRSEFGVRYLNMNANQFHLLPVNFLVKMYELPEETRDCIQSFKNFNCLITDQLPALERLTMSASNVNTSLDYSCIFNGPKQFPCLKEIEIIIDVGFSKKADDQQTPDSYTKAREFRDVRILLSHFFYDMEMILVDDEVDAVRIYGSVTTLTISFKDDVTKNGQWKASPEDLPMDLILKALPNLQRLKIVGWTAERESYAQLWKSFPNLEELLIEDCEGLEDNCFIGVQKHTNLKRLTIKSGVEKLSGCLTEEAFQMFQNDMGLVPSTFLNVCSENSSMTWSK